MSVTVKVPAHFYTEIWGREVDTVGTTSPADHILFAEEWARVTRRYKGGAPVTVLLSDDSARYLRDNLTYHMDTWSDWGREGVPYLKVGQRVLAELERAWVSALRGASD